MASPSRCLHLVGEVLGHGEAEESGEVGEDLGGLLPEERRHPAGELGPALGLGVVALDAGVLLDDLEEAASS